MTIGTGNGLQVLTALLVSRRRMKMSPDPEPHEEIGGLHSKRILVGSTTRSGRCGSANSSKPTSLVISGTGASGGLPRTLGLQLLDAAGKNGKRGAWVELAEQ